MVSLSQVSRFANGGSTHAVETIPVSLLDWNLTRNSPGALSLSRNQELGLNSCLAIGVVVREKSTLRAG
jgi:hypothetical protein